MSSHTTHPAPPEGFVILPPNFKLLPGHDDFRGLYHSPHTGDRWEQEDFCLGINNTADDYAKGFAYAVRENTEIARLNGVGFGPCPSPRGWHNPEQLTPEDVGVPEFRLLTLEEVGPRDENMRAMHGGMRIELTLGTSHDRWVRAHGTSAYVTYRTNVPYGSLPKLTECRLIEVVDPVPEHPPLPPGAVMLPERFRWDANVLFEGWTCSKIDPVGWLHSRVFRGDCQRALRYAAPEDSKVARLNGVGFGPCPSPHGWHNPAGLTPREVGVPLYRLLCCDEISSSAPKDPSIDIQMLADCVGDEWYPFASGVRECNTYRVSSRHEYGSVHIEKRKAVYGEDDYGRTIQVPEQYRYTHEVVPEGDKLPPCAPYWECLEGDSEGTWVAFPNGTSTTLLEDEDGRAHLVNNGRIRAYARLKYLELHKRDDLKEGDEVIITYKPEKNEHGWDNYWNPRMDAFVGNSGVIVADRGHAGMLVQFSGANNPEREESDPIRWALPVFVLERGSVKHKELDPEDWNGLWYVRRRDNIARRYAVTGVDYGTGFVYLNGQGNSPATLAREYERALGSHSNAANWQPCHK